MVLRQLRLLVVAAAALGAGLSAASPAFPSAMAGACAGLPASASQGLPWPVVLQTSCGRFTIGTDGRVGVQPGRSRPVPAGAAWWPDGRWWKVVRRHLVVGRWHETLWRSHGAFNSASPTGTFVLGSNRLAFSFGWPHQRLYVARLDGRERLVGSGEAPLAWTTTGRLLTISSHGGRLFARGSDGRGRRTLASRVSTFAIAPGDGTLVFLEHGRLMRTSGSRPTPLAKLAELGLTGRPVLEALGPLVALRDRQRLVVLHTDGSPFASTSLPRGTERTDGLSSAVSSDAAADAVAFTATRGNTALGSTGTETTYLLRAGDTTATAIHEEQVDFAVCERMAELDWHKHWLLYSSSEGNVAAFDTDAASQTIELSTFARALPGAEDPDGEGGLNIQASWATV